MVIFELDESSPSPPIALSGSLLCAKSYPVTPSPGSSIAPIEALLVAPSVSADICDEKS